MDEEGKKDIHEIEVVAYLYVFLSFNGREEFVQGLLHMEPTKEASAEQSETVEADNAADEAQVIIKAKKSKAWFEGDTEDALWEKTFSSWTDSKPKGPESLSLDINFPNHETVYGIP